jgi:hypothetical protein
MATMAPRRLRPSAAFAFGALAAALTAGCNNQPHPDIDAVEPMRPSLLSEQIREAGLGDGGITLTSSVPEDFPPLLALYPGARVTLGGKQLTSIGKRSWSVTVETPDSRDKVRAYYKASLAQFVPMSDVDLGESALSTWRTPALDLNLVVGKGNDGKTTVTLDVVER